MMLLNLRLVFFGGGRRLHGLELVADRLERSKLRNFPQEGHNLSSFCIKYLVAVCDACSSFQNDDMFVFILMSVHRRAIAGTGDDFNERVNAVCVRRGYTYQATFARSCFQPFSGSFIVA